MDNLGLKTMKDWSGILGRCQRDMQDAAQILTRLPIARPLMRTMMRTMMRR